MSALTAQLQAQLEAVLAKEPEARVVAVRVDTGQGLPQNLRVRGRHFDVRWCESRLALREALVENEGADEGEGLLLATPIPDTAMPADIAARLVRARVFQARDWEIVRPLFGVSSVDARLGRYEWMAQALIDLSGEGPYHSPPNRFLDLDTAWREFLSRSLGLAAPRPDAMALLEWTLNSEGDARLAALSESVRRDVLAWFEVECGAVGALVAAAAHAGRRMDAVPLATVCGVLFAEGVSPPPELAQAAVRLERYLADRHVSSSEGRAWASEAHRLVEHLGVDRLRPALDRADALLRELRVSEYARLGVLTPLALEQRLEDFAEALRNHVDRVTQESADEVERSAGAVLGHALSAARSQRAERVVMARRLARWLLQSTPAGADYAHLVYWQADQGAFVDWARFRLLGGDEQAELSRAYATLRQAVAARRNALNMAFARAIQDVNRENRWQQGRVLPLERVLETLVAPLMGQHPVLLLVMDGLSLSIFRELMARPEALGWREVVKAESGLAHVGMATLPTVTEGSRASLLCGTLRLGAAPQEKSAFSAHPALQLGSGRKAPLLFHKAELHDDAGLAGALRDALIVATSTLELGIDVGDLDRVIQIDAPKTVSSFLQRMGRAGRRPGTARNCLFLATGTPGFLQALGITRLWSQSWVEPVRPAPLPWNVVAQQTLLMTLEWGLITKQDLLNALAACFPELDANGLSTCIQTLIERRYLAEPDAGVLQIGPEAERVFGRSHYRDLLATFSGSDLLLGRHGTQEIGYIDPTSLVGEDGVNRILLAGRSWRVTAIDWKRRLAALEPSEQRGQARWMGSSGNLDWDIAQSIRMAIREGMPDLVKLSRRAMQALEELQDEIPTASNPFPQESVASGRHRVWTFSGTRTNRQYLANFRSRGARQCNALYLDFVAIPPENMGPSALPPPAPSSPDVVSLLESLKFCDLLDEAQAADEVIARFFENPPIDAPASVSSHA